MERKFCGEGSDIIPQLTGKHLVQIIKKYNLEDLRLAQGQTLIFEVSERYLKNTPDFFGEDMMECVDLIVDLDDGSAEYNTWRG